MKNIKIELLSGNLYAIAFLIMFVMKLCGYGLPATWSWWIITCPLWGPVALALGLLGICLSGALLYGLGGLMYYGVIVAADWLKERFRK